MAENDSRMSLRDRLAELEQRIAATARESSVAAGGEAHAERRVDLDAAVPMVLSELRDAVPFDSASVQELRDNRLVIIGGIGFAELDVVLGESFDVESVDTPNGEVVHRRRPYIVADTDKFRGFRRGLHVGQGIRSWLGVPLLYRDQLLGIITLDKAEPDFYTPEHQRTAMAFASILAAAMAS